MATAKKAARIRRRRPRRRPPAKKATGEEVDREEVDRQEGRRRRLPARQGREEGSAKKSAKKAAKKVAPRRPRRSRRKKAAKKSAAKKAAKKSRGKKAAKKAPAKKAAKKAAPPRRLRLRRWRPSALPRGEDRAQPAGRLAVPDRQQALTDACASDHQPGFGRAFLIPEGILGVGEAVRGDAAASCRRLRPPPARRSRR